MGKVLNFTDGATLVRPNIKTGKYNLSEKKGACLIVFLSV